MKRVEQVSQLQKSSLPELKTQILELQAKIQAQKVALKFGKSKETSLIYNLKRHLARSLTVANQKLASMAEEK